MTAFAGMLRLEFIWISFLIAGASTSKAAKTSSSFTFPSVKSDPYPVLVQIPEGAINNFLKTGSSTGGTFALVNATIPAGAGPPPHIHHWTNEWFYFPDGGLVIFSSDQQYPDPAQIPNGIQLPKANMHRYYTKPGDLIYGPAFYVHGFRNEGNVSRTVILIWTPDVMSQYFFEVGQIVTDPCKMPPVSSINKQLFVSQAPKYGINMSSYWDEYVASWSDDLQPALGMDAHGQELLNLLSNTSTQNASCQELSSHAVLLQPSCVLIYSIGFFITKVLSVLF
jgi:mannose-6-phosphate isomerase-like protein (cupin superfamily)